MMRFTKASNSYTNLLKHPLQSYFKPNHKYHSIASSSSITLDHNHAFRPTPTSQISPLSCLRADQTYPLNRSFCAIGSGVTGFRAYSSFFSGNGDNNGVDGVKKAWQSIVDTADTTGKKAKEVSDALAPHVTQLLDANPYLRDVVIPVGWTVSGTLLAWLVMPRILRKIYKYSMQGPIALLSGNLPRDSYEKSFWGSLEDPVRYLVTFMAFSQIAGMIAPTTIASQYIDQAWRGAIILSFLWFVHRWKTNIFTRSLSVPDMNANKRERIVALHRSSSVGLCVLGLMALSEAYGVAVQSILTVGGIGGIATAIAARDVLGNVLSGVLMQFSRPFSLGDTIKAGSVEGKVVEMDLTTTSLVTPDGIPIIVPNSIFSSQGIMNKSRAQWRAVVTRIPLKFECLEKVPQISSDIKSMLKSNPNVFLEDGVPYCTVTRVESQFAELTIGCNLNKMRRAEFYEAQEDILVQALKIIEKNGASLGTMTDNLTQY